jgi:hypothetical protein
MVDSIKEIAARIGAVCYADPFLPTDDHTVEESFLSRAKNWLMALKNWHANQFDVNRTRNRRKQSMQMPGMAYARVRSQHRSQSA